MLTQAWPDEIEATSAELGEAVREEATLSEEVPSENRGVLRVRLLPRHDGLLDRLRRLIPGLSAVEVADRTLMDKVAVSRAVTKLISNGRIDREFADADRRRSILNLSEQGRAVHNEIAPLALQFEHALLQDISDADYETFNAVLDSLLEKAGHLGN